MNFNLSVQWTFPLFGFLLGIILLIMSFISFASPEQRLAGKEQNTCDYVRRDRSACVKPASDVSQVGGSKVCGSYGGGIQLGIVNCLSSESR